MGKYLGITVNGTLQFVNSNQHLSRSLGSLVTNLAEKRNIIVCQFYPCQGLRESTERHKNVMHRKKKEVNQPYVHTETNMTLPEL